MNVKKITNKDRYGNQVTVEYESPEKPLDPTKLMEKQMDMMQDLPMTPPVGGEEFVMGDLTTHPGGPKGQDTVPAWLTPGEFVVNAEAMSIPENAQMVEAINNQGRAMQNGGAVYQNDGGWMQGIMDTWGKITNSAPQITGPIPRPEIPQREVDIATPISYQQALLESREGYRPDIYLDSLGKPTVGHGHLIEDAKWDKADPRIGTQPYTKEELDSFFSKDMQTAESAARRNVGDDLFDSLDRRQRAALTSMAFQLGEKGQSKFKKMIKALKSGDHSGVAREALTGSQGGKSKWLKQTPIRALDLAEAFDPQIAAQYRAAGGKVFDDMPTQRNRYMQQGGNVEKYFKEGGMVQYKFDGGYLQEQLAADPETNAAVQDHMAGLVDMPYGWNVAAGRPYTKEEGIAAGTVAADVPAPAPIPAVEDTKPWWAGEKYGDPYATISGDMGRHFTEGDFGEGSQGWADDAAAAAVAETPEYKAHEARAKSTGALPTPPQAWMDNAMAGSLARSAPASDVEQIEAVSNAAAEAANEVIEAGGTQLEAEAAADIAASTAQPDAKPKPISKDEATSNLNKLLNERPAPEDTGPGEGQPGDVANENAVKQAGDVTTPQEKKETEHWLKGVFGDLFSKEELAKTAIMYLGSRALGYSHNGSLQWAAKEHLARDTAKTAAKAANKAKLQERAFELAKTGKFDPKAIKAYEVTGDISYLQGGKQHTVTGNTMTRSVDGKRTAFQEVKDAQGNVMYTDGKNYYPAAFIENNTREYEPAFEKGTPEYRARRSRATGDAAGRFKEVFDNQDTYRVGSGHDTQVKHHTNIRPKQAADEFWAWAEKNNLDPESDQALVIMTNAYNAAIQEGKNSEGKVKPNRLTKYLEQEKIREDTGAPDLFVTNTAAVEKGEAQPQYVDGKKMNDLNNIVDSLVAVSPNKSVTSDMVYSEVVAEWQKLDAADRKRYNNSAAAGESGFYLYMKDTIGDLYMQTQQ